MSSIEQQSSDLSKLKLIKLIEKISQHKKPCGLQIDYCGGRFTWKGPIASNLSAEEWSPEPQEKRLPHGITVESQPSILHRKTIDG